MKKKILAVVAPLIVFLFFVQLTFGAKTLDPKAQLKGFPEFVNKVIQDWKVPGLAMTIVKDGKVIFSEGFGYRDVKNKLKVTPQTLFAIGSCSKAFTATSLGILVDEGKVDWDKPVRNYLPTFKMYDLFTTERMTPRDLVTHRSGLPRHELAWYNSPASRKELFERLQYLEPNKDFRTTFQYQNLMFMTAGYLAGEIAGTTWENFVKTRIFDPLGMTSSNFSVNDSQKAPDFSFPYAEKKDVVVEIPFRNIDAIGPAGSINSNVTDMAKWVMLQLAKGKFGDKQIISEAGISQLHTPQMAMQDAILPGMEKSNEFTYESYGMGWFIDNYRGHLFLQHGGGIDGFTALVCFFPRENIGMVALSNLNGNLTPFVVALNAYERLLGLDQTAWNDRLKGILAKAKEEAKKTEAEKDKDRKPNTTPSHALDDYAGDYENPGYGVFSVKKDGDHLTAAYNGFVSSLTHYHYDIFQLHNDLMDSDLKINFLEDLKGNVGSLSVLMEPTVKEIVFTRMPEKKMMEKSFLEKFVGQYDLQGTVFAIQLKGDKTLVASVPGQPEMELVPYQGTEFNIKGAAGMSIEFVVDASGSVTEAKLKQPGGTLTAKKK